MRGTLQRTLTASVAVPLALVAVFYLPSIWLFVLLLAVVEVQVYEFVRVSRAWAPHAPLEALLVLVPPTALLLTSGTFGTSAGLIHWEYLLAVQMLLSVGVGTLVLFGRTPAEESICALGVFSFGMTYFSLPVASMYRIHRLDPWLLLLLLLIIWVSDSAAYFVGRKWGRHRLAPAVSPNKTWEGAAAGLAGGMVVGLLWSYFRLGEPSGVIVALAAVTSVGGQVGDLVESMLKRGAGVKDSGSILPGHGGMLDRMDALMFGAPVMLISLWAVGYDVVVP